MSIYSRNLLKACIRFTFQIRTNSSGSSAQRTKLYDYHVKKEGKMVNFEGWEMPVQYAGQSIVKSHHHTRTHTSVFDVSHMLQTKVYGKDRAAMIESLTVADVNALGRNRGTLTVFTNEKGGILDDLIVHNHGDEYLYVVSNAGCREQDAQLMKCRAEEMVRDGKDVQVETQVRSLLAVQGPSAARVIQGGLRGAKIDDLVFMDTCETELFGVPCRITRCGYTGEDGVELSVPDDKVEYVLDCLLGSSDGDVMLAGLGARDSLRLEAGLCLYGSDISVDTTPVEAGLAWVIAKTRRSKGDFPGASVILNQLKNKPERKRVGVVTRKGPPARGGASIFSADERPIGNVTSGCPSPSLGFNISMGYVSADSSKVSTAVSVQVRNKMYEGEVVRMPFQPTRYYTSR